MTLKKKKKLTTANHPPLLYEPSLLIKIGKQKIELIEESWPSLMLHFLSSSAFPCLSSQSLVSSLISNNNAKYNYSGYIQNHREKGLRNKRKYFEKYAEVEAKVFVKLNIKLLENGETNECDRKCIESHGDCKQYLILSFAPVPWTGWSSTLRHMHAL